MDIEKSEIIKIFTEHSNINLSIDFQNQSKDIPNFLSNEALSKLIQEMQENQEFHNEVIYKRHLDVFITVNSKRKS